jgi:hypothetical protein
MTGTDVTRLRSALAQIRAQYDHGAVSPAVFRVIREIETEIAWEEHRREPAQGAS